MLRRQRKIRTQVQRLVDAGLFALSFYLAYWLRAHPDLFGTPFLARELVTDDIRQSG